MSDGGAQAPLFAFRVFQRDIRLEFLAPKAHPTTNFAQTHNREKDYEKGSA